MLLHKYGKKWKRENFYAGKYFNAFPDLLEGPQPRYGNVVDVSNRCYSYRVFTVFMDYFGLIKMRAEGNFWDKKLWVSKSPLFDKLVKVEAPKYP